MAAEEEQIPENIAAAITEISERATLLIRDEIELARAEIGAKISKLVTGAVVGIAAGIFIVVALFFVLIGLAWLAWYELFPAGQYFWGFFVVAGALLLFALLAGVLAAKLVRRGSPPSPKMAIDEARKIREAVGPREEAA
ncbi:MAG: phage holin family protein [Solirubrobacteraceae bacterium]